MAVLVTLLGILQGMDPWEILQRSLIAFSIVAIVISATLRSLHLVHPKASRAHR